MSNNKLLERGLPKWPQMRVTGTPVSKEQALEIIRRTDIFFTLFCGNDKEYIKRAMELIGAPQRPALKALADESSRVDAIRAYFEKEAQWRENWGIISTDYVRNSWISSSFVHGPHGWCHPDGTIGYAYNVGKWPSIEDVQRDWAAIAKEFPFLELEITLMDGEWCEEDTSPVVSMLIRQGTVELVDPKTRNIHEEFSRSPVAPADRGLECLWLPPAEREHAIGLEQIREWGMAFLKKCPEWR